MFGFCKKELTRSDVETELEKREDKKNIIDELNETTLDALYELYKLEVDRKNEEANKRRRSVEEKLKTGVLKINTTTNRRYTKKVKEEIKTIYGYHNSNFITVDQRTNRYTISEDFARFLYNRFRNFSVHDLKLTKSYYSEFRQSDALHVATLEQVVADLMSCKSIECDGGLTLMTSTIESYKLVKDEELESDSK